MALRATSAYQHRRESIFFEIGLGGDDAIVDKRIRSQALQMPQPWPKVSTSEKDNILPTSQKNQASKPKTFVLLSQLLFVGVVVALVWPGLYYGSLSISFSPPGADASPVPALLPQQDTSSLSKRLDTRDNSPTDVCKRWGHMSAVVNGTLYVYGGQAMTSADQTTNTWNNDFLALDLTKNWQIGAPSLTGLPQPSGPPAVALGALWNDLNNLYVYGGEFSWQPVVLPTAFSLWQYSIKSSTWLQHSTPEDTQGQVVQRSAEGAGVSVPGLGRGYSLGGHLDGYTTEGWSQSIPRLYLESTLEYTMPGSTNSALSSNSPVGSDGVYRNISADSAGFPRRADGVLVYIPGYSDSGIILGVGGGTSSSFTQMNIIDVYDIATSKWYKQATSGPTPKTRVNPCAVAVSAADGSSTQLYMYGGQNLQPAGNQTQYDDMWILTIPSFTWIQVDQSGQSTPPARAGHSCNVWNSQLVVVGGYVGTELSCDSPGIYIFNTSSLAWQTRYNALPVSDPLNRQPSQNKDSLALQGSYGYEVPLVVRNAIGGNAAGAATVTQPAQTATQGPLQSGKPKTYTVTGSNGAVVTQTSTPGSSTGSNGTSSGSSGNGSGTNVGAIVAGVIAGLLAILALYLGFCVWVYRKQLKLYKHHVAVVQHERLSHESNHTAMATIGGTYIFTEGHRSSDQQRSSGDSRSGHSGGAITGSSSTTAARRNDLHSNNPYRKVAGGQGYATAASSTEDLAIGQEPSFIGVMLNPRRSLRVMNRD